MLYQVLNAVTRFQIDFKNRHVACAERIMHSLSAEQKFLDTFARTIQLSFAELTCIAVCLYGKNINIASGQESEEHKNNKEAVSSFLI